ncbi:hypothetical protein JCM10207_006070 [Rhodosporidiobolus poonsookiae]
MQSRGGSAVSSDPSKRSAFDGGDSSTGDTAPVKQHLEDLKKISGRASLKLSLTYWARRSTPISFVFFLYKNIVQWLFTLALAPATAFTDPTGTVAALTIYPLVWSGLFVAVAVFWVAGLLGGQKIITWMSNKWANGYSIVNWPNPQIFGPTSKKAIDEARAVLEGDVPTTIRDEISLEEENPDYTTYKTTRVFSLPLARTLLLMSALVYERSDAMVRQAADIAFRAQQRYRRGSQPYEDEMRRAEKTLLESERVIKDKAAEWDLEYDGVSDLVTVGGPFASIFYTKPGARKPFVVLVFKGTGPTNFPEFLTDATINRIGAGVFFGPGSGTAHQGFYSSLFMTNDRASGEDGYGAIVRTLKHVAARMRRDLPGVDIKIPLWVTGHSLGSALASLCYARFLRSPEDLGDLCEVHDCYSFGTPRLGSGDFATAFEETLIKPLDRTNILWRVRNHSDVVGVVPPGLADNESSRAYLPSASILNYAWLSACIRLQPSFFPHSKPYYKVEKLEAFHAATQVKVTDYPHGDDQETDWKKRSARWRSLEDSAMTNPLRWLLAALPSPVYDHFPASYLEHLGHLETTNEQLARRKYEREHGTPEGLVGGAGQLLGGAVRGAERLRQDAIDRVNKARDRGKGE